MSIREIKRRVERLEAIKQAEELGFIVAIAEGDTYDVNGEKMTRAEFEAAYANDDNVIAFVIKRLEN
jgi:hypothetical protein